MGPYSEIEGRESGPEAGHALLEHALAEAVNEVFVGHGAAREGFLLLDLGFDVVEGEGDQRDVDGGQHGGGCLDLERTVVSELRCQVLLDGIVSHHHGHVQGRGSDHSRHGSAP